jgi:hypothetical protein
MCGSTLWSSKAVERWKHCGSLEVLYQGDGAPARPSRFAIDVPRLLES